MMKIFHHQAAGTYISQPVTTGTRDHLIFALSDITNKLENSWQWLQICTGIKDSATSVFFL